MSPRGHPDYVTPVTQVYIEGLAGLEELATRLGSIVPWDLHGNIVLMEDFESEITEWEDESDGLGSTFSRSSTQKYSGDFSAKLYSCGIADAYTGLIRQLHYPGLVKYGLFGRFHWDGQTQQILFSAAFYDVAFSYEALIRVDAHLDTLAVKTTDGAFHNILTGFTAHFPAVYWWPILLTFDLSTNKYDKLYFGNYEYDLSSVALRREPSIAFSSAYIDVMIEDTDEDAFTVYVDNIVLVKNVP